jgi:Uma2 family endonuclease
MVQTFQKSEPVTIAAFDAFIETQDEDALYELVDGDIVMMSNPTDRHEQIAANIQAPLKLAMDQKKCLTFAGGMRVQASDWNKGIDKTRPDIVVRCGAVTGKNYITDPVVIVEVLSPSTMDHDRGPKLAFYKSLPSVEHIALVYQDQRRVEHYRRVGETFELEVLIQPNAALTFGAVDFSMALEQIYFATAL